MREGYPSRNPRKPMMLSIAVAFAFAATFGGPMGEQLSQASQAEPVVTSIMFEDRFVRLIFPGHAHQHARRRLPLIVHLHGFSAFPGLVDRALDGTGSRYSWEIRRDRGGADGHPPSRSRFLFLERHRGLLWL